MKLSVQFATVLSSSPKAAVASVRGTGAFAPAMEKLIAGLSSETPVMRSSPGGQMHALTSAQITTPLVTGVDLAGENQPNASSPAVDLDKGVPIPHEAEESTVVPQSGPQKPVVPEGDLEHQLPVPPLQSPVIQEAISKQSSAELREARDISETDRPPRELHKTDKTKPSDASNIATPALPDMPVPSSQILPQSIAIVAPQPEKPGMETGVSKSSAEPVKGRVDTGNKRRPAAVTILPAPVNPAALTSVNRQIVKAVQNTPQQGEIAAPPAERSAPMNRKVVIGAPAQPSQAVSSAATAHRPEGHEATVLQSDPHPSKESQKETLTVVQGGIAQKASIYSSPAVPAIQQQTAPSVPIPAMLGHRMQEPVEAHRAEANAAQVLQRMDEASPADAMQLRADARHLDVGVTAGSLGWVEVRASVNPNGKVDAALHLETNASAHLVAVQSKEIADYARTHSIQLGQVSVGVGTGDGSRGSSGSTYESARNDHTVPVRRALKDPVNSETRESGEKVSLISIRA